jgi:hypothetical protein
MALFAQRLEMVEPQGSQLALFWKIGMVSGSSASPSLPGGQGNRISKQSQKGCRDRSGPIRPA